MPGKDLALPVERKVIAVLGDKDMSQKAGRGQSLGDWALGSRRLVNGSAAPATVARPADADDPQPRGHIIEHLADGLTNQVQFSAAAGAGFMIDIEPQVFTGQLRRKARPI